MLSSKLQKVGATIVAALAVLALAAPAAGARKPVTEPPEDLILLPIKEIASLDPIYPCICLPAPDSN